MWLSPTHGALNTSLLLSPQVLIIVVVLSMALTPGLAELGKVTGEALDQMLGSGKPGEGGAADGAKAEGGGQQENVQLIKGHQVGVVCVSVCRCVYGWQQWNTGGSDAVRLMQRRLSVTKLFGFYLLLTWLTKHT